MKNNIKIFKKMMSANYTNIINELATTYSDEQMNSMESYSLYFHFDVDNNLIGNIVLSKVTNDRVIIPNENGGFTYILSLPLCFITNYAKEEEGQYHLDKLGALQCIKDSIENTPLSDYVYSHDYKLSCRMHSVFTRNYCSL